MRVFVIIVTYNPLQWIDKCFGSLRQSTLPVNTIVIDNGSSDGSQRKIKSEYPEVDFVASKLNLGFGAANNIGIKKAYELGADFVLLLNQDAWIESDTISKLVEVALQNNNYGILSPIHYNGPGSALDYNFSTFVGADRCPGLISDYMTGTHLKDVYQTNFVNAAVWLLTRKCIETVGGFNPTFFHYAEDLNYADRVTYHQLKIGIVPSVKIFHDRQGRKSNKFLADPTLNFQRILYRELSRPEMRKPISYFYWTTLRKTALSVLGFDKNGIQLAFREIQALLRIKYHQVVENRALSLKKSTTFLK